jgi:hypothetical protein
MSDSTHASKPGSAAPTAHESGGPQKALRSLNPGEVGPARMNPVREERAAAAAQISRSMKAWRAASGPAGAGSIPKGGGAPLGSDVRGRMEPKLGASLGNVKVHTGSESATAAKGFGARAFTVGEDIHFNAGQFAPGTKEGDKLLAHELTHVVQGQKSGVQRSPEPDDKKGDAAGGDKKGDAAGGDKKGAAGEAGGEEAHVSHPEEPAEKEADAVSEKVAGELHDAKGGDEKGEKKAKDKKEKEKEKKKDKKEKEKEGGPKAKGDEKDAADAEPAAEEKHGAGAEAKGEKGGEKKGDKAADKKGGPAEAKGPSAAEGKELDEKKEGGDGKGGEKPAPIAAKLEGVGRKVFLAGPGPAVPPRGPAGAGPTADPAAAAKQQQIDKAKNCKTPADVDAFCAPDPIAVQKLADVKGETNHEDNAGAKAGFYDAMAKYIQTNAESVNPATIFNACMNNLAGPYKFKGNKIDVSKIGKSMQRTQGLGGFYGRVVDKSYYEAKAAGAPDVGKAAFALWKQEALNGNPMAHLAAGQIEPTGGTWFTPDSYKLKDGSDAGYSQLLQLAALQPEWFPEGNIVFEVDVATAAGTMEARKPTAYDGMQSALWVSRPTGDTFGVTGGGANEFLAGKIPIGAVKNAKAVIPSASTQQELADAVKAAKEAALAADPDLKKKIDNASDPKVKQQLEYLVPTLTDMFIRGTATMPLSASVQKMLKDIAETTAAERAAPSAARAPGEITARR